MAVTCVFGMTQSGKSHLVERKIIPLHKRVLVFDKAPCFHPHPKGVLKNVFSMEGGYENWALDKAVAVAAGSFNAFSIGLRPDPRSVKTIQDSFKSVARLAIYLGKKVRSIAPEERILFVVDEADFICSNSFQPAEVKHLVNVGRHDNVDSLFIARIPQRIHGDIKANASRIISFKIQTAPQIGFFLENFGRETAQKIRNLPQYHFFTWEDTGKSWFTDGNGKIYDREG